MDFTVTLTEDVKRAMRYLGYSEKDIKAEIERQCSDIFENLIKRAKRKWVEKREMKNIFPEPLTE